MTRLREEGVIDGWGMGVNCPQPILRCLEVADSDVHLLASNTRWSITPTRSRTFPKAREKGMSFVVGSALNAGFLGGEPRFNYGEENTLIPQDKRERLANLRAIASRHGVDLAGAALKFSIAPDVAAALIVGTASPDHVLADYAALRLKSRTRSGESCGRRVFSIPTPIYQTDSQSSANVHTYKRGR